MPELLLTQLKSEEVVIPDPSSRKSGVKAACFAYVAEPILQCSHHKFGYSLRHSHPTVTPPGIKRGPPSLELRERTVHRSLASKDQPVHRLASDNHCMVLPGTEIIIGIHGVLASHSESRDLKLHPAKGARAEDYVTP